MSLVIVTLPVTFTSTLSVDVERPPTFTSLLKPTTSLNVEIPVTFNVSAILTISNSERPSTSKLPFASIFPVNVDTPETFKLSVILTPEFVVSKRCMPL